MADVQIEHGYTKIANELLDAIIQARIPAEIRRVFDYIMRMTYGYSRKTFETTQHEIAKALKTKQPRIAEALKTLTEAKMINNTKNRIDLNRNCLTILGIQKDFERWETIRKNVLIRSSVSLTIRSSVYTSSRKKKEKGNVLNNTEKRIVYRPPTGEQLNSNGKTWIDPRAWDEFVQHRKDIHKPLTALAVKKTLKLLEQYRSRQSEIIETSIRNGWQGLFPPKGKSIADDCEGPRLPLLEAPNDRT